MRSGGGAVRSGQGALWACVLLALAPACTGDSAEPDAGASGVSGGAGGSGARPSATTVVVLPDTQFYACAYPTIFQQQADYILAGLERERIAVVLHTGDIVDQDVPEQWQVAAESLHRLNGKVPYLVTSGNHDLSAGRASLIGHYFGADTQAAQGVVVQARDPGRPDNSFAVVELAGRSWLVLGLEFGPRDAVVKWASDVLSAHADLPAIVFTHAYLYSDAERYDRSIEPLQPYHPDSYAFTPEQGIADGEDLWRELIEPHENVQLVVCGHVIPDGTARAIATRSSGTHVHQLLANYQLCDTCPCTQSEGGGGYLRLLRFDDGGRALHVSTYSPHRGAGLTDPENEFDLSLDL
jgi:hypothetical protein